jgi:hypothetical protein
MTILELFDISKNKTLTNTFIVIDYKTKNVIHINATAMDAMENPTATLLILFLLKDISPLLA